MSVPEWKLYTSFGILNGVAKEYVYEEEKVLSELIWNFNSLRYTGISFDLNITQLFFLAIEFQTIIPVYMQTGSITDEDFLNTGSETTHFSSHDLYTKNAINIHLTTGRPFHPRYNTVIAPFVEISYLNYGWSAENGYIQYPAEINPPYTPWDEDQKKTPFSGVGIIYTQQFLIPAAGLSFRYDFFPFLSAKATVSFSPFVYCFTEDQHIARNITFTDEMFLGVYFRPQLNIQYKLLKEVSVKLIASWIYIDSLRGDTTTIFNGNSMRFITEDTGGADFSVTDIGIRLTFSL